jgi:hypothetical protein
MTKSFRRHCAPGCLRNLPGGNGGRSASKSHNLSRLSRQCGSLNVSQTYKPARAVGIGSWIGFIWLHNILAVLTRALASGLWFNSAVLCSPVRSCASLSTTRGITPAVGGERPHTWSGQYEAVNSGDSTGIRTPVPRSSGRHQSLHRDYV